jgi:hypothetical protein
MRKPWPLMLLLVVHVSCTAAPDGDAIDDDFLDDGKADTGGIAEGGFEAIGVLRVANELAREELVNEVRLVRPAVDGILAGRPFATLAALDAVSWVGPIAFARILETAKARGLVPEPVLVVPEGSLDRGLVLEGNCDGRLLTTVFACDGGGDSVDGLDTHFPVKIRRSSNGRYQVMLEPGQLRDPDPKGVATGFTGASPTVNIGPDNRGRFSFSSRQPTGRRIDTAYEVELDELGATLRFEASEWLNTTNDQCAGRTVTCTAALVW